MLDNAFNDASSYSPQLAHILGGVTAVVLWDYLRQCKEDWVTLDAAAIAQQTGLTPPEQEMATTALKNRGFLQEQLRDGQLQVSLDLEAVQDKIKSFQKLVFPQTVPPQKPLQTHENDPYFPVRPSSTQKSFTNPSTTPHFRFSGPWNSAEELQQFQRVLIAYFTQEGHERPSDAAFYEIDRLSKGLMSPYWEEFVQKQPLGSSQTIQQEWEVEPGRPYPAFEEERVQYYVHKGEPLDAARVKARYDLKNPKIAQLLWESFLQKCDRLANEAQKALELGVKTPYLPPSFTEKPPVSKQQVTEKLQHLQDKTANPPQLEPNTNEPPPNLEILQKAYNTPLGKTIIARQIAQNPQWGYKIIDDKIVDLYPF